MSLHVEMVNAPAGRQAGAARCCHRQSVLAWRLSYRLEEDDIVRVEDDYQRSTIGLGLKSEI